MNHYIEEKIWNEAGFDCSDILKKFGKITNQAKSISLRIDNDLLQIAKAKFTSIAQENYKFIQGVQEIDPEYIEFIHLIIHVSNRLDETITKSIYEKIFHRTAPRIQKMIYDGFMEKPESDLLRKVHYTTMIEKRRFLTCSIKDEVLKNNISGLSEETAQNLIQKQVKKAQRNKINVWYVLETEQGTAIFVYVNAKTMKTIPSIQRKLNNFLKYAKPNIVYVSKNCENLKIYSGNVERGIKYASAILCGYNKGDDYSFQICFQQQELESKNTDILNFIDTLLNEKDSSLTLKEFSFIPDDSRFDSIVSVSKQKDSIIGIINDLKTHFGTEFIIDNIISIQIFFKEYSFIVSFQSLNENEGIVTYNHAGRTQTVSEEFTQHLKNKYKLNLNKKSR